MILLNVILPWTPRSSKCSHSFRLSHQIYTRMSFLSHPCYMFCRTHSTTHMLFFPSSRWANWFQRHCVRKVLGSNVRRGTDFPNRSFLQISSASPPACSHRTLTELCLFPSTSLTSHHSPWYKRHWMLYSLKGSVFWKVRPCNLVDHRLFGGMYCVLLQNKRETSKEKEADMLLHVFYTADGHITFLRNVCDLQDYWRSRTLHSYRCKEPPIQPVQSNFIDDVFRPQNTLTSAYSNGVKNKQMH
jgi:hypothetical protein